MEHIDFLKEFPLLPPKSLDPLVADGYIETAEGRLFEVLIDVASANNTFCLDAIKSTSEVSLYLESKRNELDMRFKQCTTSLSFVKELRYSLLAFRPEYSKQSISEYYEKIIQECDATVGWDNVVSFDKAAETMEISLRDDSERTHQVYVNFKNDLFSCSIEEKTYPLSIGLSRYIDNLKKICTRLADSWSVLDEIDKTLCVLHPQHPKRTDLSRRIAISDLATALFEVSPDRYYPKVVIYGPKSIASALNAKAKNIKNLWSSNRLARENLQDALGIVLPEPESFRSDQSDIKLECGICLSFDLDGDDPDQVCTSDICARPFHRRCLIQWLASKDDTRQSYNTYFGKCPYCKSSISVATC